MTPNIEGFVADVKQAFKALAWRAVGPSVSRLDERFSKSFWYFIDFIKEFFSVVARNFHAAVVSTPRSNHNLTKQKYNFNN